MTTPLLRNILLIDDEPSMRHMLRLLLEQQGYRLTDATDAESALTLMQTERFDLVLSDIRMPGMGGLGFLKQDIVRSSNAVLIMMSAYGGIDAAVECLKLGAYDYISKPFKNDEILLTLKKAEERTQLELENRQLKKVLAAQESSFSRADIIHTSAAMRQALEVVDKVAAASMPVLITGETGTGKELIARALHSESPRASGPFMAINCSAISRGLLESELFGHLKGSFTGADRNKQGLFEAASGGSLFLDEIADLPLELQPKLLRVLQEGEIRPVGSIRTQKIDTRVIAACGTDLKRAVEQQRFRNDLFFRLAVIDIHLPPLRERCEDIPLLAEAFVREFSLREGKRVPEVTAEDAAKLKTYSWPGNVRELRNFIEKALIFSHDERLELPLLPDESRQYPRTENGDFSLKVAARRLEIEYIHKALAATAGNRTQAARLLDISLRALLYKIKEYDLA